MSEEAQPGDRGLGLLVIWPVAPDAALDHLAARFTVLDATEVVWTPSLAETNFTRLTGRLPSPSERSAIDAVPALVVLIADLERAGPSHAHGSAPTQPDSRMSEPAVAMEDLSVNSTSAHVSTGHLNVRSDYMLLLERDLDERAPGHEWTGPLDRVERDLAGAGGWHDVRQMLRVLGAGPPYAVLRNFEGLADLSSLEDHGDIDLLVADYPAAIRLLDAVPRLRSIPRWGGRFDVEIDSSKVICDIRFPGDGYYDPRWMRQLLRSRELHSDGFYVLENSEYLESLLYHAIVHKPQLSTEYRLRLRSMAINARRPEFQAGLENESTARDLLASILERRGFQITRPRDPTVYFNHTVREVAFPVLWRVGDALQRRVYRFALRHVLPIGARVRSKPRGPTGDDHRRTGQRPGRRRNP